MEISSQMMGNDQLTWAYAGNILGKDSGKREVYGIVSGPKEDLDMQGCDPEWLKRAIPEWFKRGNIRQMHSGSLPPAGKASKLAIDGDEYYTAAKIINDDAWKMVEAGVYTGFSVGIKNPVIVKDAAFKNGLIAGGDVIEVSLVDFPAYKSSVLSTDPTMFTMFKRRNDGLLVPVGAELIGQTRAEQEQLAIDNRIQIGKEKAAMAKEWNQENQGTRASYTRPFAAIPGVTTMEEAIKAASDVSAEGTMSANLNKGAKDMAKEDAKDDAKADAKADAKDEAKDDSKEDEDAKSKSKSKGAEADVKKGDVHIHLPADAEGDEEDDADEGDSKDDDSKDESSDDPKDESSDDDKNDSKDDEKDDDEDDESESYARNYAKAYAQAMAEAKTAKSDLGKAFPPGKQAAPFGKDGAKDDSKEDAKEDDDAKSKAKSKAKTAAKSAVANKGALTVTEVMGWMASASLDEKAMVRSAADPVSDQGTGDGKENSDPIVDLGGGVAPKTPSPKKLDLTSAGKDSAGIGGEGAPGFKAAVKAAAIETLRDFLQTQEAVDLFSAGREAKAAVEDVRKNVEAKAAELDTTKDSIKAGVVADITKAFESKFADLAKEQDAIKRMTQPSKSVQSENVSVVERTPDANKSAQPISSIADLMKAAQSPDPNIAVQAQEQIREIVTNGETAKSARRTPNDPISNLSKGTGELDLAKGVYAAQTRR